jgi:hypothetical protein
MNSKYSLPFSAKQHLRVLKAHVRFLLRSADKLLQLSSGLPSAVKRRLVTFTAPAQAFRMMHEDSSCSFTESSAIRRAKDENCYFSDFSFDQVVVGSGPGGATAALVGEKAGLRQLVIEKGGKADRLASPHSPSQMLSDFDHGGLDFIASWPPIAFSQGSVLGGGSEVNSGLFHFAPKEVVSYWSEATGLQSEALNHAGEEVARLLRVERQSEKNLGIYSSSPLKEIGSALGWQGGVIPRWREYKSERDYRHFGLSDLILGKLSNAHILEQHRVIRLQPLPNSELVKLHIKGNFCRHEVLSPRVVLAAGTVGTPDLLWRSGLAKSRDFKFGFHAMVRVLAQFERAVNDLHDIDPHQYWTRDYRLKIGAAVGTQALLKATFASQGLAPVDNLEKVASFYVSLPARGKLLLRPFLSQLIPIFLPDSKFKQELMAAYSLLKRLVSNVGGRVLSDGKRPSVSTVHVFGSLPIGTSSIVDNRGRLVGHSGKIRIRDASILPSAPMVNPQGPMMQLVLALEQTKYFEENEKQ